MTVIVKTNVILFLLFIIGIILLGVSIDNLMKKSGEYINNFSDPFKNYLKTNKNGIIYLSKDEMDSLLKSGTINSNDLDAYNKFMELAMNDGILYMAGLILIILSFILLVLLNVIFVTYNIMELGNRKNLPLIEPNIISNKPFINTKQLVYEITPLKKVKKTNQKKAKKTSNK